MIGSWWTALVGFFESKIEKPPGKAFILAVLSTPPIAKCYEQLSLIRRSLRLMQSHKTMTRSTATRFLDSASARCGGWLLLFSILGTSLTSCADLSESTKRTATRTGVGAATGAVAGGIIAGVATGSVGTGAVVGSALGALGGFAWSEQMDQKKLEIERSLRSSGTSVRRTRDNRVHLAVPRAFDFKKGDANIKRNFYPVLDNVARTLKADPLLVAEIVGKTSYNESANDWDLSMHRALKVREYLLNCGVNPSQIQTQGVGSGYPVANDSTAEGRARNRSVEIFIGMKKR